MKALKRGLVASACALTASAVAGELNFSVTAGAVVPFQSGRTATEFRIALPPENSLAILGNQSHRDMFVAGNRVIVIPIGAADIVDVIPSADGQRLRVVVTPAAKVAAAAPAPTPTPTPTPTPSPPAATPAPTLPALPAPPAATATPAADKPSPVLANYREFSLDLPVPDSPAFVLLGLSPDTVTRPATARELVASWQNGVDKTGKLKTGLALDTAPLHLALGQDLSLDGYKKMSSPMRAVFNTQLSVATSAGAGDDDKTRKVGLGLNIPLYDAGDPRLDGETVKCLNTKAPPVFTDPVGDPTQPDFKPPVFSANAEGMKGCYADALKRSRSKSAWIAGFGQTWTSLTGDVNDAKTTSRGYWTSITYGFEGVELMAGRAQLVLSARRMDDEVVADPLDSTKVVNQDSQAAALQFRLWSDTLVTSLEYSRQKLRIEGRPEDRINRAALGVDYKLDKNMWLSASVGGEGGRKNGENKNFVFGGIKYGRFDAPQFLPK